MRKPTRRAISHKKYSVASRVFAFAIELRLVVDGGHLKADPRRSLFRFTSLPRSIAIMTNAINPAMSVSTSVHTAGITVSSLFPFQQKLMFFL